MKLDRIAVKLCRVPEVRITAVFDEELQKLLRDSLVAMGQVQPIVVTQAGEEFIVVDGAHRLEEARRRGDELIDAVIYAGDAKDALLKNLVLNRLRGKTKASEMVKVMAALGNDYRLGIDEIRDKTGLSRDYIEKLLKVSTASPSVIEALDQEIIGVGHAFEVSRLSSWVVQDEIMSKYQVWRWTVKELHEQVEQVLAMISETPPPAAETKPSEPAKYCCEVCKKEAQLRYLRAVLLCPDCFGVVWREHKEAPLGTAVEAEKEKQP
jgi:ParB-like chromosome segregation protein Spo0J